MKSNELLVGRLTVDDAIQIVVPSSLRQRIPMVSHYSPIAGQPGQLRMCDTLRRNVYWHFMAADVDYIVNISPICAINNPKYRHQRKLSFSQHLHHSPLPQWISWNHFSIQHTAANICFPLPTKNPGWTEQSQVQDTKQPQPLRIFFLITYSSLRHPSVHLQSQWYSIRQQVLH